MSYKGTSVLVARRRNHVHPKGQEREDHGEQGGDEHDISSPVIFSSDASSKKERERKKNSFKEVNRIVVGAKLY